VYEHQRVDDRQRERAEQIERFGAHTDRAGFGSSQGVLNQVVDKVLGVFEVVQVIAHWTRQRVVIIDNYITACSRGHGGSVL